MRREIHEAKAYIEGRDEVAKLIRERSRCYELEGFWLEREDALKLLELLDRHGARVLGGDVALKKESGLELSGDNWQCGDEARRKTIDFSREYVRSYPDANALFHIVWKDAIGRYEDLMKRRGGG